MNSQIIIEQLAVGQIIIECFAFGFIGISALALWLEVTNRNVELEDK